MSHVYYCCNSSCLKQSDVQLADFNLLRNFRKKFPKTTPLPPLPPLPPKKRQCPLSWGSAFVLYLGFLQMNESSSSITKILSPTILTCLLLPWTLQKLTIRALTTPTMPPPKRSHYNLVTLVVQLNAKKINKKYKIITKRKLHILFCKYSLFLLPTLAHFPSAIKKVFRNASHPCFSHILSFSNFCFPKFQPLH